MRNIGGHLGVALLGLVTFGLTVLVVTVVERLTTFNLFTLSVWVVIPVGAAICGGAAASGYYFGSLFFHTRPTWFLLVEILIVAAVAQLAIYYAEYSTLILDDGTPAPQIIGFWDYLDAYVKSMHLRVGRGNVDTGEVGQFGYWLAAIQFVGFILGGAVVWLNLRSHPVCSSCGRYLRKLMKHTQGFSTQEELVTYYDSLFEHPVDTQGFADMMHWQPRPIGSKVVKGVFVTETTLHGCPHCKQQVISQEVKIMGDKDWQQLPQLTRAIRIPDGIDLRPVFRSV
jgi:hypothetical protein